MSDSHSNIFRTIRMDKAEVEKVLDAMDEHKGDNTESNLRTYERFTYRNSECVVHIKQPGAGTPVTYFCPTRNISEGGVSFLHGGFVYAGSEIRIQLISAFGAWQDVNGTVVSCDLVKAPIHEVCVRFDQLIDPGDYCQDATKRPVLLVDDDLSIVRLATVLLQKLKCNVETAENGQVGVEMALKGTYEVIIMDIEMPVMDGFTAVKELRAKGYSGDIVAATAMTLPEDRERCRKSGFNDFIAKPYSMKDLSKVLDTVRKEPLLSTLINDADMIDIITSFVESLPDNIRVFEEAIDKSLVSDLEIAARSLKGEAGGYGFEPISTAAEKLERGIQEGIDISQIKPLVSEVVELCTLARAPRRAQSQSIEA